MTLLRLGLLAVLLVGCPPTPPAPTPTPATGTQVTLTNQQSPLTAYVTFGADSKIKANDWKSFCTPSAALACSFMLTGSQALPNPRSAYLNMTVAFGTPVGCNATKAEVNVNNPSWYDTLDVSLVDGYSNKIEIDYTPPGAPAPTKLGPPNGQTDNEKVLGVYPYGCDICVARQNPPCGISKGTDGCKSGTQYKPDVACQYQGAVKGGGGTVNVTLLP